MSEKLLIIANPCSGKGKAKKLAPKIAKRFSEYGYDVNLMYTNMRGDAKDFASAEDYSMVVAIGGDGTLNETINGVMASGKNTNSLVGYIPMGSTNDFASSMKIPTKWKKAVDVIANGKDLCIDIARFNDRYFTYVAGYGMFTQTSCTASQKLKNKLGHFACLLLGVKEVFKKNNYPIKIEVDGELVEGEYAFLGFGNTKSIGGVLKFKDDIVEISDGKFEVLLVKYPKNLWHLSRMLKKFMKSDWQGDGLTMLHGSKAKIFTDKEMLWSLDGEKLIINEDAEIEMINKAIKIRVGN